VDLRDLTEISPAGCRFDVGVPGGGSESVPTQWLHLSPCWRAVSPSGLLSVVSFCGQLLGMPSSVPPPPLWQEKVRMGWRVEVVYPDAGKGMVDMRMGGCGIVV